eukprot:391883-Rhodomonas_salina.6
MTRIGTLQLSQRHSFVSEGPDCIGLRVAYPIPVYRRRVIFYPTEYPRTNSENKVIYVPGYQQLYQHYHPAGPCQFRLLTAQEKIRKRGMELRTHVKCLGHYFLNSMLTLTKT